MAIKFKFDRNLVQTSDEKFIIDTGGWLGHGVSLFVHDGQLIAVVGNRGYVWVVCLHSLLLKSVQTRIFSGPCFPVFGLNTEIYGVNLRIQSKCGKIRTRRTPYLDDFHTVHITFIRSSLKQEILIRFLIIAIFIRYYLFRYFQKICRQLF